MARILHVPQIRWLPRAAWLARLRNRWSGPRADLGLSLGSSKLGLRHRDREAGSDESSCLAVDRRGLRVVACGHEARSLDGRVTDDIRIVRPIQGGAITDTTAARHLLERALQDGRPMLGPHAVLGVSSTLSAMERRSIVAAAKAAGAREVHLVDQALLAALGAGVPVLEPEGSMVVDLGAGTSEVAVLAGGHTLNCRARRTGGDAMDEALRDHVRQRHGIEISSTSAERLKVTLASALPPEGDRTATAAGRDLRSTLPTRVTVTEAEVHEAIRPVLQAIAHEIRQVLSTVEPDLLADIMREGAVLTGGVALMPGLAEFLQEQTGMTVRRVPEPEQASARGLERILSEPRLRRRLLGPGEGEKMAGRSSTPVSGRTAALILLAASLLTTLLFSNRTTVLEGTLSGAIQPLSVTFSGFLPGGGPSQINDEVLKAHLAQSEARAASLAAENQRLRALHRSAPRPRGWQAAPVASAPVVGRSPREWLSALTLGAGSRNGLEVGMVAVAPEGLLGTLNSVGPATSQLKLLPDATVVLSGEVKSRKASGVIYGTGDGLELRFLDPDSGVREGDLVTTTGLDGMFPPGLTVGRVAQMRRLRDDVHATATVRPAVDTDGVREVLLLSRVPTRSVDEVRR